MDYKKIFDENNYTLMLVKNDEIYSSYDKGVKPLLDLIDKGYDLSEYVVYDKVIGKGAAFLYVLLNAKIIYTNVISKPALDLLKNTNVQYDILCSNIINRDKTNICPIEMSVLNINDAATALPIIKKTLENLVKNTKKL